MTAWICVAVACCAQAPAEDRAALLRTFRDEFVAITPGEGKFPAKLLIPARDSAAAPRGLTIAGSYAVARYEVPQNLYEAVVGKNPSRWKGERNSVEMVSYVEARDFCARATTLLREAKLIGDDEVIRLPTEAEWEYACRAGATTAYSFGDDAAKLDEYGWHTGNAAGNDPPVGAKKPNAWDLYDFHGYVAEWCEPLTVDEKKSPGVVRGGSWKEPASDCRCDSRRTVDVDSRDDAIGFRCVLAKSPKE